jgi:hypothetical protein
MKRNIYFFISIMLVFFVTSCDLFEVDTYPTPNETLKGDLRDKDGNPLITEQPNGFKIRIIEEGSPEPRDFWGKPDGTFFNSKIFKGNYKIIPTEGAFFPVDTLKAEISGVTTINFEITPFVKIDASIIADGPNLKAIYTIKKAFGAGKIQNARLLVNKWNPNVGMNYNDNSVLRDLSGVSDETIEMTEYSDQIYNYLESGVTYYARVAVLSENAFGRYNFSEVQEIVVQ